MGSHKRSVFIYATIVAMGGFVFGLDAALISGVIEFLTEEFSLTAGQLGTLVAVPNLGVLVALPFAGHICNRFGRKKAILLIAFLYIVSAIGSAMAPSYRMLVVARFVGGLAFSSISLASMYIGEIAQPKYRGKLVSMTQINIVVGLSAAYFINYLIQGLGWGPDTWRWMLAAEIPFALLWILLLLTIPESPAWYFYRGRIVEAKQTLRKLMPESEIDDHVAEVEQSLKGGPEDRSLWAQLAEIFGTRMRLTFIIAFTIAIAQQATGINAVLFYAQTIFKQLGIGTNAAFVQAIWVGLTSVVFTIVGLVLVDKLGRRPLIIWGMVWIIISLGLCSYAFKGARYVLPQEAIAELTDIDNADRLRVIADKEFASDILFREAIVETIGEEEANAYRGSILDRSININTTLVLFSILSFIAAFHFSVGPVMWVLFSEIFPVGVRGIAIPFFTIVTSVTSWFVQYSFPTLLESMGMSSIFLFYASTVLIGLLILCFTLKETKNMSIEEIQEALSPRGS